MQTEVSKGDLIGIANGEVYFVGDVCWVEGKQVVNHVISYRPVEKDVYEQLSDEDMAVDYDDWDHLHEYWKHAVEKDLTELGYQEFAREIFREEKHDAEASGNELWFFGQDCSGEGSVLCEDMVLHEQIKEDLEPLIDMEIGSWEWSSWTEPTSNEYPIKQGDELIPMEWDVVYNQYAVDACNLFAKVRNNYDFDEWLKIIR